MHRFTLLLASNVHAITNLGKAKEELEAFFNHRLTWSEVHESQAHGTTDPSAPRYLNAVCQGLTPLSLEELTRWLKALESAMGRQRGEAAKGQVTLDLDLVVWDDTILRPVDAGRTYYLTCLADLQAAD